MQEADTKYKITLSNVPVRSEPAESAEMVHELLFGEYCSLLEKNEKENWIKVRAEYDHYEGWVYYNQLSEIKPDMDQNGVPKVIWKGPLLHLKEHFPFYYSCGTELPLSWVGEQREQRLREICRVFLGVSYRWGGKSLFGADCSGFVQTVFKCLDVWLPRDAWQQHEWLAEKIEIEATKEGDLAFFRKNERITHVGIILENRKIIHASGYVRVDQLDHNGIFNAEEDRYTHDLADIKRIRPDGKKGVGIEL